MQNPDERELDSRLQETRLDVPLDYGEIEPSEPAPAPYVKEPLFNKKVMLVWAVGAALVWFAFSFVLPIAFESAKSAIVQSIKEAEKSGSNVVIKRDGQTITITTQPSQPAGTAAPSATATPSATGAPADLKPAKPVKPPKPEGPATAEPSRK
jgi:hypothetical protein